MELSPLASATAELNGKNAALEARAKAATTSDSSASTLDVSAAAAPEETVAAPVVRRYTLHPAFRDLGLIGGTSILTTIAAVAVISLLGRYLGPALLGEYLLVRRVASWLQSLVAVPSGIALPRYVAASVKDSQVNKRSYFLPAFLIGNASAVVISVCLILGKSTVGRFLLGSGDFTHLLVPIGLMLIGLAAHSAVFGYYQGDLSMFRASALQTMNLAVVPFASAILLWHMNSVALIVDATGIAMIAIACLFALPILFGTTAQIAFAGFTERSRELMTYGSSRTVGDFGLQGLLSLPALIAAHFLPIAAVSALLLGGSFLGVVSVATLPLGLILLSRVARALSSDRSAELNERIIHFMGALIELSAFITLQMLVFSDVIVRAWVGPKFLSGLLVVQIAILTMPFYFVHSGLRSLVDAGAIKAYNTRNIVISLIAFLVACAAVVVTMRNWYFLEALALCGMFGLAVLSWLTWRTTKTLFEVRPSWKKILPGLTLAIALGGVSYLLKRAFPGYVGIPLIMAIETFVCLAYLAGLHFMRVQWLIFVRETALPGFASSHSGRSK